MPRGNSFDSDGVRIVYDDLQPEAGDPIVLIHGFASSRGNNWEEQGWYDTLTEQGRRVIALDNRGHGESDKPHDPDVYGMPTMAGDTIVLLDHLGIEEADIFGYSMGGRISIELVQSHPERINAAILGGVGAAFQADTGGREAIAEGLEAEDVDDVDTEVGRAFRLFAEENGNDLDALAAVIRAHSTRPTPEDLAAVSVPVLVATGENDERVGDPEGLADAFGDGEAAVIPGTDHLTTVSNEVFEEAILAFLDGEGLAARREPAT